MNLHKVKGLEARVVFLACSKGENRIAPSDHVDRNGEKTLGYLQLTRTIGKHRIAIVAQPVGWEAFSACEEAFQRAEQLRLRYVAATRAGEAMIVTIGGEKDTKNPWQYFAPYLDVNSSVPLSEKVHKPQRPTVELSVEIATRQWKESAERRAQSTLNSYLVESATGAVKRQPVVPQDTEDANAFVDERAEEGAAETEKSGDNVGGAAWGTVIHRLLELKMNGDLNDEHAVAREVLEENGLAKDFAESAVQSVAQVSQTPIWHRAINSDRVLTEIPFEIPWRRDDLSGALRGVIDLVFKENDQWVIVDYKTDSTKTRMVKELSEHHRPQIELYKKAFEESAGQVVKETGLLFVGPREYVKV